MCARGREKQGHCLDFTQKAKLSGPSAQPSHHLPLQKPPGANTSPGVCVPEGPGLKGKILPQRRAHGIVLFCSHRLTLQQCWLCLAAPEGAAVGFWERGLVAVSVLFESNRWCCFFFPYFPTQGGKPLTAQAIYDIG